MLSERVRNTIVGITMLGALGALMAGVVVLNRLPTLTAARSYNVTLQAPNANGVAMGNRVDFNGVPVGTVSSVELTPDMRGVRMVLHIDPWVSLPANATAVLSKPAIGAGAVSFTPGNEAPSGSLPKDGSAVLRAEVADNGLVPKTLVERLTTVGESLQELLEKRPLTEFEKLDPEKRVANISVLVQRLDRLAKGFDQLIGDPQTQQQFRQIIANIHDTTGQLKTLIGKFQNTADKTNAALDGFGQAAKDIQAAATQANRTLSTTEKQILTLSEKMVGLLESLEKTTTALSKGNGTTGKLINDPRLYEGLVDLTTSLKHTSDDLNFLLRKWKDEGVDFKLK